MFKIEEGALRDKKTIKILLVMSVWFALSVNAIAQEERNAIRGLGGVVTADQDLVVAATMNGVLKTIKFELGEKFKKGDILASFECGLNKSMTDAAKAEWDLAKQAFEDGKEGFELLTTPENQVKSLIYSMREKEALYKNAKYKQDECYLRAGFDGEVAEEFIGQGEYVPLGTPIMRVINKDELYIKMNVPETSWKEFEPDSEHIVEVPVLGTTLSAKVDVRSNYISDRQYFIVHLKFKDETGMISPGMTVSIK